MALILCHVPIIPRFRSENADSMVLVETHAPSSAHDGEVAGRVVEPTIVLEVAFNNMMRSERHDSGFALRFPRIVRIRHDKSPEDADTVERAREIYERQGK